jgi:hypothetical protein
MMVYSKEDVHLADKAIFVDPTAFATLGLLGPHLFDVLQDHIAVAIKRFHSSENLAVIAA